MGVGCCAAKPEPLHWEGCPQLTTSPAAACSTGSHSVRSKVLRVLDPTLLGAAGSAGRTARVRGEPQNRLAFTAGAREPHVGT